MNFYDEAVKMADECRDTINFYIKEGIKKEEAVEMAFLETIIGKKFKDKILSEYK